MPVSRSLYAIHDDEFAAGVELAFPTMSTCAACIVVLGNRLVGIHKTASWKNHTTRLFQLAANLIGTAVKHRLYIAGWNAGVPTEHDTTQIRNALGCMAVPTYVFNYRNSIHTHEADYGKGLQVITNPAFKPGIFNKSMPDLCTFAFHDGTRARIGVKRTTKVTVNNSKRNSQKTNLQRIHGGDSRFMGCIETITTPSDHLHWLSFTRV